jgi:hypothetical protein
MLTCLVSSGVASQRRPSAVVSAAAVVNPFFEIVVWRSGSRRELMRIRVVGITAGERVLSACAGCAHASFRQSPSTGRVTLVARHALRMGSNTRIIVGVTASRSIGRWIVIGFSHHQYRGLKHGCTPADVTSLSASSASDPSSIPRNSCVSPCASPTGYEYVEWQGTDDQLWELQFNGRRWGSALPVGSGALGSAPAAVVRAGGQRDVFWKGTDGKLNEMWYGGFWNGPIELKAAGRLRSLPAGMVDSRGVEHLFWRGRNRWLWELSDPGGVWGASFPMNSGRVGSTPAAVANAAGGEDVFWRGTRGKLWEIRDTTSWGSAHNVRGAATIGSSPTAVSTPAGVDHVFWKGTNGFLWEISNPGGKWGGSVPLNSGRMGSAPSAVIQPSGEIDVFWKGTDGRLRELRSSGGGWRNPIRIAASGRLGSRPAAVEGRCR